MLSSPTRVRARYAKTGKLRFVSAIDLGRIWERALRRAGLPIAYSEGFSPHPKVSFPDALPLGYASTGEYVELTFAAPVELESAMAELDAALGDGLDVLAAAEVDPAAPRLSKWLTASLWQLDYPEAVTPDALDRAARDALAATELPVTRQRKGEPTEEDLRPALHDLLTENVTVRAVLHHLEPPLRPSELHDALDRLTGGLPPPALITRVAQGQPGPGGLHEALSGDLVRTAPRSESEHRDRQRTATTQTHPHPEARGGGASGPAPAPAAAGAQAEARP